jgi:hypothetical protein
MGTLAAAPAMMLGSYLARCEAATCHAWNFSPVGSEILPARLQNLCPEPPAVKETLSGSMLNQR